MTSVLRPVASTALTKSALSHALTSPLRATYLALGAAAASSAMSGPLGPLGSDAVVMIGALASSAILASTTVLARRSCDGNVLDGLEQAGLVIEQQDDRVVGVEQHLRAAALGCLEIPDIAAAGCAGVVACPACWARAECPLVCTMTTVTAITVSTVRTIPATTRFVLSDLIAHLLAKISAGYTPCRVASA